MKTQWRVCYSTYNNTLLVRDKQQVSDDESTAYRNVLENVIHRDDGGEMLHLSG